MVYLVFGFVDLVFGIIVAVLPGHGDALFIIRQFDKAAVEHIWVDTKSYLDLDLWHLLLGGRDINSVWTCALFIINQSHTLRQQRIGHKGSNILIWGRLAKATHAMQMWESRVLGWFNWFQWGELWRRCKLEGNVNQELRWKQLKLVDWPDWTDWPECVWK